MSNTIQFIILKLTLAEAEVLVNLMDAAVRSEGIKTAEAAVPLFQKVKAAASQPQPMETVHADPALSDKG